MHTSCTHCQLGKVYAVEASETLRRDAVRLLHFLVNVLLVCNRLRLSREICKPLVWVVKHIRGDWVVVKVTWVDVECNTW